MKIDRHYYPAVPHFVPQAELTREQIDRQDAVENALHELINALIPPQYAAQNGAESPIEWNIEIISEVRETVETVIFGALGLVEENPSDQERAARLEQFEMNFYPFLSPEGSA